MEYDFSTLLLQLAQAFLEKNTEEIKSIGTKLSTFKEENDVSAILDTIAMFNTNPRDEYVGNETIQAFLNNADIENSQSVLYMIKINREPDPIDLTADEFKQKDYYQFFINSSNSDYASETVKSNFLSQIALRTISFKDPELIQGVLQHIQELNQ